MVLAATNRPMDLDEALRRRLEKRIYIPLPGEKGRKQLFDINLKGVQMGKDLDFEYLIKRTKGYSGADIANVCRDAAMMPLRKKLVAGEIKLLDLPKMKESIDVPIMMNDFKEALKNISKSVSQESLKEYADWMKEFGSS
jgi:katanin p60 ATPase-containing subunit A1